MIVASIFLRVVAVLGFAAWLVPVCLAPDHFGEPRPQERGPIAEQFIKKRLINWQERLKLADWKISIRMVRSDQLRRGTLGSIRWDATTKAATIRVLHPTEYQASYDSTLRDMEFTIVHELIHLVLSSLPRSEASRSDEEHAVNRMAEALLNLDQAHTSPQVRIR